jgi:hypothetical protein
MSLNRVEDFFIADVGAMQLMYAVVNLRPQSVTLMSQWAAYDEGPGAMLH